MLRFCYIQKNFNYKVHRHYHVLEQVRYLINMLSQSEVYGTNSQHEQTFYIDYFIAVYSSFILQGFKSRQSKLTLFNHKTDLKKNC